MDKKFHFLYKTTNIINGSYYIGIHSTDDINDGYFGSGIILKKSINKYGLENFKIEIIEFVSSREELKKRENEIVNENLLSDNLCMNLQLGGTSGFDYLKMKRQNDPEYDKEFRNQQGEKMKKAHRDGKIKYDTFSGRKHKKETIDKLKGHNRQKGERNSQFGTCWVTNDIENKKIKKEELPTYLSKGWVKGRKMVH